MLVSWSDSLEFVADCTSMILGGMHASIYFYDKLWVIIMIKTNQLQRKVHRDEHKEQNLRR